MSTKKKKKMKGPNITQSESGRYYADFRAYHDVLRSDEPQRKVALVPPGATLATTNKKTALHLYNKRVEELEARRNGKAYGIVTGTTLAAYVPQYLAKRKQAKQHSGRSADEIERDIRWLRDVVFYRAINFFGRDKPLKDITTSDVEDWLTKLSEDPGPTAMSELPPEQRPRHSRKSPDPRSAQGLRPGTRARHRVALHAFFKKALGLKLVSENPVAGLDADWKYEEEHHERRSLETEDAALLLEAAFMLVRPQSALPHGPQAIAIMLLAGLRLTECRGLLVRDVDWAHRLLHVQKNPHRRVKSMAATRWVPIFPQLEELLRPHWTERAEVAGPDALLFPGGSSDETGDRMMSSEGWRNFLDQLCEVIGVERYTQHELRHTFITHAVRLTPGGVPIRPGEVRDWSGHESEEVQAIYDHQLKRGVVRLGDHVEYRIKDFLDDPAVMARYQRVRDACMPWCLASAARAAAEKGTPGGTKLRVVA